eukprot:103432_1
MSSTQDWRGTIALCVVAIQFGIQPLLTEWYIPRNGIKTSMVIIQDSIKLFLCIITLAFNGTLFTIIDTWTLRNSLRVALVPSVIYCIQNVLAFYAYLNLDPLTFNLINQSKIIFAAMFLKLILNKTPTNRQLLALFILFCTSILLTVDTTMDKNTKDHSTDALLAILLASLLSGLAGTLTQKALQAEKAPRNSLLFSCELAVYGMCFAFIRLFMENMFLQAFDGVLVAKYGLFHNLDKYVLIPIGVNALGGIGVGLITKYVGVIHKSYALISGIVLSGVLRSFLFAKPMTTSMYIAVPLVALSLWLNADPSKLKKEPTKRD